MLEPPKNQLPQMLGPSGFFGGNQGITINNFPQCNLR